MGNGALKAEDINFEKRAKQLEVMLVVAGGIPFSKETLDTWKVRLSQNPGFLGYLADHVDRLPDDESKKAVKDFVDNIRGGKPVDDKGYSLALTAFAYLQVTAPDIKDVYPKNPARFEKLFELAFSTPSVKMIIEKAMEKVGEKDLQLFITLLHEDAQFRAKVIGLIRSGESGGKPALRVAEDINAAFIESKGKHEDAQEKLKATASKQERATDTFDKLLREPSTNYIFLIQQRLLYIKDALKTIDEELRVLGTPRTDEGRKQKELLLQKKTALEEDLRLFDKQLSGLGFTSDTAFDKWDSFVKLLTLTQYNYLSGNFDYIIGYLKDSAVPDEQKMFVLKFVDKLTKITGMPLENLAGLSIGKAIIELQKGKTQVDVLSAAGKQQWQLMYEQQYMRLTTVEEVTTPAGERATRVKMKLLPFDEVAFMAVRDLNNPAYVALAQAYKTMSENGVASPEASQAIVYTLMKINMVNPVLQAAYLKAITNLAEICSNNPKLFQDVLMLVTTEVEALIPQNYLQAGRPNTLGLTYMLLDAFEQIGKIQPGALAEFARQDLMMKEIYQSMYPPYEYRLKSPWSIPQLVPPEINRFGYITAYPFSPVNVHPLVPSLRYGAAVYGAKEEASFTMPSLNLFDIRSFAQENATAMNLYLSPQHVSFYPSEFLPGSTITTTSYMTLLKEIRKAFIPTIEPIYSSEAVGGGGFFALDAKKYAGWDKAFVGLVEYLTPTGGAAIGGSGFTTEGREQEFVGAAMVGMPVGKMQAAPLIGKPMDSIGVGGETYVHSSSVAWEHATTTDTEYQGYLANLFATVWDPKNPANMVVVVRSKEEGPTAPEPKREEYVSEEAYQAARVEYEKKQFKEKRAAVYYIDKQGNIYDLRGGSNSLVGMLDYLMAQVDSEKGKLTVGGNVYGGPLWGDEGQLGGGGAFAIDVDKVPLLAMVQAVPSIEGAYKEGEPHYRAQRLFYEWVGAGAWTKQSEGKTDIFILSAPGIKAGAQGGELVVQKGVFTWRRVLDPKTGEAWELQLFGGGGKGITGDAVVTAGAGYRYQLPASHKYWGTSLSYTGAEAVMDVLAMEDEHVTQELASLKRLAASGYWAGPVSPTYILGTLGTIVWHHTANDDAGLYRFIVFLKSMKEQFGLRIDTSRFTGIDWAINNLDQVRAIVSNSPGQTAAAVDNWKKAAADIRAIYEQYSLGVRVSNDLSAEGFLVMKEDSNSFFGDRTLDVTGWRALYTFGSGFVRAQGAIPTYGQTLGYASAGLGFDLFPNARAFQKVAMDLGILLHLGKDRAEGEDKDIYKGWYTTGALRVYSDVLEDVKKYRELKKEYQKYGAMIASGDVSKIPAKVKEAIGLGADLVSVVESQKDEAQRRLYDWFNKETEPIQKDFDGKVRVSLGWGVVFPRNEFGRLDIGAVTEIVDKGAFYIIGSYTNGKTVFTTDPHIAEMAKGVTLYSGFTLYLDSRKKITLDGVGGLKVTGEGAPSLSGGVSTTFELARLGGMPLSLKLLTIYTSPYTQSYMPPFYMGYPWAGAGVPELFAGAFLTLGGGRGIQPPLFTMPAPYGSGMYGPGRQ